VKWENEKWFGQEKQDFRTFTTQLNAPVMTNLDSTRMERAIATAR